jgi:hypothetical protein
VLDKTCRLAADHICSLPWIVLSAGIELVPQMLLLRCMSLHLARRVVRCVRNTVTVAMESRRCVAPATSERVSGRQHGWDCGTRNCFASGHQTCGEALARSLGRQRD